MDIAQRIMRRLTWWYRKSCQDSWRRYNRLLFWADGVRYGRGLNVYNHLYLRVYRGARVSVGNNFTFLSGFGINPLSRNLRGAIFADAGATITIGNDTGISSSCLWAKQSISIGHRVKIGANCAIIDNDAHSLDWRVRAGMATDAAGDTVHDGQAAAAAPIVIGDDVLIGTGCIILKGVTIGARSVIGAGSVVTRPIPAGCIAAGNPCKVIKQQVDEHQA